MIIKDKQTYKSKPDFQKALILANEILTVSDCIKDFPFNMIDLIEEQSDIQCCSYKKAMRLYGVDIKIFGSKSAILFERQGRALLFFNQDEADYRIRFSLAHEFGHYLFNHRLNVTDEVYRREEIEANFFAGQLLMPEQIISTLQSRYVKIDADYLKRIFGVSADAAERKIRTLKRATKGWRSEEECGYDAIIKTKFADFITRSIPASHQTMLFPDYEEVFSRQQERDRWLSMR